MAVPRGVSRKRIEGCHRFSTLSVCHLILHPIALINPQAYLADVLERIADHPIHKIDALLPWLWTQ
jgi:IS66 C-terminal element